MNMDSQTGLDKVNTTFWDRPNYVLLSFKAQYIILKK